MKKFKVPVLLALSVLVALAVIIGLAAHLTGLPHQDCLGITFAVLMIGAVLGALAETATLVLSTVGKVLLALCPRRKDEAQ